MTIQINVLNGAGSTSVPSGGSFTLATGMIIQLQDVLDDGSLGPIWDPSEITAVASGNDIILTFPNGETLVLADAVEVLSGQALGDQLAAGGLPEDDLEPGAGPGGGGGGGPGSGSIQAAVLFVDDGFGNAFGLSPSGSFTPLGGPGLTIPGFDPNLLSLLGGPSPIPQLASFGLPPGDMTMGLEDKPIPLLSTVTQNDIEGLGEILSVEIRDIPPGAVVTDANGTPLFTSMVGATTFVTNPTELPTLQIIPAVANDDSDFTVTLVATTFEPTNPAAGTATATVMLPIVVKAVADLAKFTLDNQIAGEHPMSVIKNPIQIEMEGRGATGANDPDATAPDFGAQDLGVLPPLGNPDNPEPVITVDGWINVNDPNDVDLYKVVLTETGSYKIEINHGQMADPDGGGGRIDDAILNISLYSDTGTFFGVVPGVPGGDPLGVAGPTLPPGTYFVAITQSGNLPAGGSLSDGFTGGGGGDGGDYQLTIQRNLALADFMPGDMFTHMVIEDNAQIMVRVAVFDDPAFVDTGGTSSDESDEIQASIAAFGHAVSTFTGTDETSWVDALANADVVVVPELSNGNLGAALAAPLAIAAITNFVNNGGKLIIAGHFADNAENFLDAVFGFDVEEVPSPGPSSLAAGAAGTAFEGGPDSLQPIGNQALQIGSLPPGVATPIYLDGNGNATVVQFDIGAGRAYYLGDNWHSLLPAPGSSDGGWNEVLGRALGDAGAMLPPADQMYVDPTDADFRVQRADVDLMVTDTDGSESITRVRISLDSLPPGFMLDINGDNTFLTNSPFGNTVRLPVTRILVDGDPPVDSIIIVDVTYDAATGEAVFEIPEAARVQSIDLGKFSWKVDQHNDQDFMIKFEVRTTETNPSEGTTLDETQVATPHAYQTATLMVNNKAVADKPTLTIGSMVDCEDNAEFDAASGMFMDNDPIFAIQAMAAVTDTDLSESLTEVKIDWSALPTVTTGQLWIGTPPVVVNPGPLMLDVMTDTGAETVTAQVAITGQMASLTFLATDRVQSVDLNQLGLRLPQHKDGKFDILIEATATETNPSEAGDVAVPSQTQTATFTLDVQAVADKALVSAPSQSYNEDKATLVSGMYEDGVSRYTTPVSASLLDQDGSETITVIKLTTDFLTQGLAANEVGVRLTNSLGPQDLGTLDSLAPSVMVDVTLNDPAMTSTRAEATLAVVGGELTFTFAESPPIGHVNMGRLAFDLPQHKDGVFNIDWMVTTKEVAPMGDIKAGADTATQTGSFSLTVGAVADKPTVAFPGATPGTPNPVISVVEDNAMAMPDSGVLEATDILQREVEQPADNSSNDTVATAQDLGAITGNAITGNAATSLTVSGFVGTADQGFDDVDFYSFTVTQAGTFYLDIDGASSGTVFDSVLSLFNNSGQLIAWDDNTAADPGSVSAFDSFIGGIFLEAGVYTVAVSSLDRTPTTIASGAPLSIGGEKLVGTAVDTTFSGTGASSGDYQLQIRTTLDDKAPGWASIGDVSAQGTGFGAQFFPTAGASAILLTTEKVLDPPASGIGGPVSGVDAVPVGQLEAFFGLAPGDLDGLSASASVEGSGIQKSFFAEKDQVLTFDWNFLTNEATNGGAGALFDVGFVVINAAPNGFVSDESLGFGASLTVFNEELRGTFTSASLPASGLYTLGIGVIESNDPNFASGLLVDNVQLSNGPLMPEMTFDKSNIHTLGLTVDAVDTDGSEGLTEVKVTAPVGLDLGQTDWFLGDVLLQDGPVTLTGGTFGGGTTVTATVAISADGQMLTLTFPDATGTPADQVLSVDLSALAIRTPRHLHGRFDITVDATSKEQNPMGSPPAAIEASQTRSETVTLEIAAVADKPQFSNVVETANGATAIPLDFKITTPDSDGSEGLSALTVSGLPPNSSLTYAIAGGGTSTNPDSDGDGIITINLALLPDPTPGVTFENGKPTMIDTSAVGGFNLTLTPPPGTGGNFTATITATSTEMDAASGPIQLMSQSDTIDIEVATGDPPVVDLDGSEPGSGRTDSFTEGTSAVAAVPTPIGEVLDTSVMDNDSTDMSKIVFRLVAPPDGFTFEQIGFFIANYTGGTTLTTSSTSDGPDRIFTITRDGGGNIPTADVELAIQATAYFNTSESPTAGNRTIEVQVCDELGIASNTAVATIDVIPVNDPPMANADSNAVTENDATDTVMGNVRDGDGSGGVADTDPDHATTALMVSAVNGSAANVGMDVVGMYGTLRLEADGSYSYVLDNADPDTDALAGGAMATETFNYTIIDPFGLTSTTTLTIDIAGFNDPPVALDDEFNTTSAEVDAGTNMVGNVITNPGGMDSDVDGGPLEVSSVVTGGGEDGSGLTFSGFSAGFIDMVTFTTPGGTVAYQATITTSAAETVTLTVETDGDVFLDTTSGTDPFESLVVQREIMFDYVLSDGAATTTANVTIEVGPTIWFIDNNPANWNGGAGSGTQDDPFHSIEQFNDAVAAAGPDDPQPNDIIYLRSSIYIEDDGINLLDGQILIGQGQGLDAALSSISGTTVNLFPPGQEEADTPPTIRVTGSMADDNGIDLASNNVIRGLEIGTTNAGNSAISGAGVGNLDIEDVVIRNLTGQAIDIDGGGTLDVTFNSILSAASSGEGIDINNVGGNFTVTGATIVANTTGTGIDLTSSGTASFTFTGDLTIVTTAGAGLVANDAGTLHIDGGTNSINATGGAAVDIFNSTLDNGAAFMTVSATGGTNGINLDTVTGSFTATGGTITNTSGNAVDIRLATEDVSYGGDITNTAGRSVEVTLSGGTTANTISFSGAISDSGTGINLDNNDQGAGATINFSGGLDLDTTTSTGFTATNGGTVNVDDTGVVNDIDTTTGFGVNFQNTNFGTTGVSFQSISTNGAFSGIVLNNTGTSGSFTVTGTGSTAGSGGLIQNTTNGVTLTNANNVSLANLDITNTDSHGIRGTTVSNLDLNQVRITDAGDPLDLLATENGISLTNLRGTAAAGTDSLFENITITGSADNGIQVNNNGATNVGDPDSADRDLLTVNNSTIINSEVGGIQFISDTFGTGNMRLDVTGGSTFTNNEAVGIAANANGGTVELNVTGNNQLTAGAGAGSSQFRGISGGATSTGALIFNIDGNTIEQKGTAGTGPAGIALATIDSATMNGTVANNVISSAETTPVFGVSVTNTGSGTSSVTLDTNDIDLVDGFGVNGDAQGASSGTLGLTVTNNSVDVMGTDAANTAMRFAASGSQTLAIDVTGNTAVNVPAGFGDIILENNTTGSFQVQGLVAAVNAVVDFLANTPADPVETLLSGNNLGGVRVFFNPGSTSTTFTPVPQLAAAGQGPGGVPQLSEAELSAIFDEARARWEATGLTEAEQAILDAADYAIVDLDPGVLGAPSSDGIWIDLDAAGWGWFVDATPWEDSEFDQINAPDVLQATAGPAAEQLDLLTVVMHELGHLIGRHHEAEPGLMAETLDLGVRYLPEETDGHDGNGAAADSMHLAEPDSGLAYFDQEAAIGDLIAKLLEVAQQDSTPAPGVIEPGGAGALDAEGLFDELDDRLGSFLRNLADSQQSGRDSASQSENGGNDTMDPMPQWTVILLDEHDNGDAVLANAQTAVSA